MSNRVRIRPLRWHDPEYAAILQEPARYDGAALRETGVCPHCRCDLTVTAHWPSPYTGQRGTLVHVGHDRGCPRLRWLRDHGLSAP